MGEPLTIPYRQVHESLCPFCWSPATEYHPAERYGRCHACGGRWRFEPYTLHLAPVELAPGWWV